MFGAKESIVIVEAKNCGKYAKQLYNLIGMADDEGEKIVGPEDGSVHASIMNEVQFTDTRLSSDQKVVFIGLPRSAKDYIDAIKLQATTNFVKHGIEIHVSGKHASVQVDSSGCSPEDYWAFLDFAADHGQTFDDLLAGVRPSEAEDEGDSIPDGAPFSLAASAGKMIDDAGRNFAALTNAQAILDQKYQLAIKIFYRDYLNDFVRA